MKRRWLALLLTCAMILSLAACGGEASAPETAQPPAEESAPALETSETRAFTDSLGRTVQLPAEVDKIALSGPMAQIVLFALCPDRLVGISNAWSKEAEQYLDPAYFNLPEIGQLYGGKGELNLETLLASGAQVVVDVGEPKGNAAEELDALQEQVGVPFVHVSASIGTMDEAYRLLGELTGMEAEAEELAEYCASVYQRTLDIANAVEKKNVLYITGEEGLNVIARGSYHAEIMDLLTNNLAVVDDPSSKGTGNEVDLEQIMSWSPDVVIFSPESIYDTVGENDLWQSIPAIRNGTYYEVPFGPYNWMGFPPSVQRLLGMTWMAKILYPEQAKYDMFEETATYYEKFYHCQLTREQYDALVEHSLGK